MRKLDTVETFGGIDADADDLLDDCFQDHEAYTAVLEHKKPLVIGRKGSGKTAIFRRIVKTRSHDFFSFGHTFFDYPWHHHRLQEQIGVASEQRYMHSWEYLVLLTMAKVLLNSDQSQPWGEDTLEQLSRIEKFVVDSYGSRDPDVTQLFTPTRRLRIQPHIKLPGFEIGASLENLPISELPKVVQEFNRTMALSIVRCMNPDFDYFVCFDELDRGFDPKDEQYTGMLIGLLLAAKHLNDLARSEGRSFSVAVFLRDDIYERLRFEDKNKLTEQSVTRIEWDTARTRWTLKKLMAKRFSVVLGEEPNIPVEWEQVFDESQEMSGRQSKYQHILDRTFRRPRDIIKFCNSVLDKYRVRRLLQDSARFTNDDIISARNDYSEYLLKELEDEVHKHAPGFDSYLEILKSLGALQFELEEFSAVYVKLRELFPESVSQATILRELFEFSVIAYQRSGGVGGGSAYVWRYQDPKVRFDETATHFRIHPGFMEAFGLKKFHRRDLSGPSP